MSVSEEIVSKLIRCYGVTPPEATDVQMFTAMSLCVKDLMAQKRRLFRSEEKKQRAKRVHYLCMEFLIGKSLKTNLINLGLEKECSEFAKRYGYSLEDLYACEPDPALGNGGLGRLGACFLDSLTSLSYPATGYSICYEYGLFKQKIIDGEQLEKPDIWLPHGEVWLIPRQDKSCRVYLGGRVREDWSGGKNRVSLENAEEIDAVPYDMMISGRNGKAVNLLRLFRAQSAEKIDMRLFSQGEYIKAVQENTNAETISKMLYPPDNHVSGRLLRLSQQYFLCSASLQSILSDHVKLYRKLDNFAQKNAIHINDTHPALVIPELMRILMDDYDYGWDKAWEITTQSVSYTNHTVMPEAMECWREDIMAIRLPRIYSILKEMDERYLARFPDTGEECRILSGGHVRMANLSVIGSHKVNGVSELHSEILKKKTFHAFAKREPEKFTNVNNGITHTRWLCGANPALSELLDQTIGPQYREQPQLLENLIAFREDKSVLEKLEQIKRTNKEKLTAYIKDVHGRQIDPEAIFDVQIKRMHEYKRQLLNVLRILSLFDEPTGPKRTFLFAAKAASNYDIAKEIIRLIYHLGEEIRKDERLSKRLSVVFLEDYNVSLAERIIPAAEISEQLSLAGKEASGTGNMKLMMNGALTVGTLDGANVQIRQAAGEENFYLFGMNENEVDELWRKGYHAGHFLRSSLRLQGVMERLKRGINGQSFEMIENYLTGSGFPDPYMCMGDFDSYCAVHAVADADYTNSEKWNRMSLMNIATSGVFSSDRSVREYAEQIWHIKPLE